MLVDIFWQNIGGTKNLPNILAIWLVCQNLPAQHPLHWPKITAYCFATLEKWNSIHCMFICYVYGLGIVPIKVFEIFTVLLNVATTFSMATFSIATICMTGLVVIFSMMTFDIMTLSIITLSIVTFSITTFCKITFSKMVFSITIQIQQST
jgi:hypothetical protein